MSKTAAIPTGLQREGYDTNVLPPVPGTKASMFLAEQYASCTQAVMPLSYNWTAMTTLVNSMQPAGNTNQGIGLALGLDVAGWRRALPGPA